MDYLIFSPETGQKLISTPTAQMMVSNTILQWKEPRLLGELVESRVGAVNKDEPGVFCGARK